MSQVKMPPPDRSASQPFATELMVDGMTCSNCARKVQAAIQGVPGVAGVTARLESGRALVHWSAGIPPAEAAVLAAVRQAGYGARPVPAMAAGKTPVAMPGAGWRFNVIFGAGATGLLMLGEWGGGWGMVRWFQWLALALALPVQIFCGARFYRGAWNQLKVGSSNMDTLVALGSTTAFVFSVWGLLSGYHGHLYFMEGTAIITLISIGHWLEARASAKAASALQALMNLAPATARRLNRNMSETTVAVAELQIGDSVVLRPGDCVPTDGTVAFGQSAVDESMLTGESLPVEKNRGAKLYAGTVNQNSRLVMRVTATGEATALAHIIAVVERAQNSRANIQRLGDRVSGIFVPVVILIALGAAFFWIWDYASAKAASDSLRNLLWPPVVPPQPWAAAIILAVAVLIVACPCAMGLATPAAVMAGANAAARRGILVRDGRALEKSGTITAVVFDKTGTLTTGRIACAAMLDLRAESDRAISWEQLAAALAQPSSHPLSQAIARLSQEVAQPVPPLEDWQEIRGKGVEARWPKQPDIPAAEAGGLLRLGALRWLEESGVNLQSAATFSEQWASQGATVLGISAGHRLLGVLALRDSLKAHAGEVVRQLGRRGKKIYLITGDTRRTAIAIAQAAGIPAEHVFAEAPPAQKAEIIKQLQQQGGRIAFVGDGINDAPALKQADLGIAVSHASDVAREAADIILLNSEIQAIPEALELAQATLRVIKQNLFWAFFYNAAAIPLAALGYLSPVLCAAAMGASDLIVIGNALRLYRWKHRPITP